MLYAVRTTFIRILRRELTPHKDTFANYANNNSPLHPAIEFDKTRKITTRLLVFHGNLMHGNATCTHYVRPEEMFRSDRASRIRKSATLQNDHVRLTITSCSGSRPDCLTVRPLNFRPGSFPRVLSRRATAQVPGADPPGGTQDSLSPREGLIALYWRVAPRLR